MTRATASARPPRVRRDVGLHLRRAAPVVDDDGRRQCASCGAFIDPIDWCADCQSGGKPCGTAHRHLRKQATAAFCDAACRSRHRTSYVWGN